MDVLHDNSRRTWYKLGTAYEEIIPDYVMAYPWPSEKVATFSDSNLFADDIQRLFPLGEKAAVWLSAAYFAKNAEALDYEPVKQEYVEQRIKDAATVFGITADVETIMTAVRALPTEKQAEDDDSNYGWVMRSEAGEVRARKYPMFDDRGVKLASTYFSEYRQNYPLGIRRSIARKIMQKAAEYGIPTPDLSPAVLREAGFGIPRRDVLMSELLERAHLTKDAEHAVLMCNVNELIAGMPCGELGQNLDKIAEVIEAFDEANGLKSEYNRRIMMPADFLFDIDLKTAEAVVTDAIQLGQRTFSVSKLAALEPRMLSGVLGEDFVSRAMDAASGKFDCTKLADELHSLPLPDKAALEEHLARSLG